MQKNKKSKNSKIDTPLEKQRVKVLVLDIETSPLEVYVWNIWENNVNLTQIIKDWSVLSWAAKWLNPNDDKVMYESTANQRDVRKDKDLLKNIWKLLDKADVIITQNGIRFDKKKLNARFKINGFKPPSSYKHIDTKALASKHFGFTSNSLEYLSSKLCKKYKKLKHKKFPGLELWKECLKGNKEAWKEMELYNKHDVLTLEELYTTIIPWDNSINFNLYDDALVNTCKCGSNKWSKYGYKYTSMGKFQRYVCVKCGSEVRDRKNLLTKEKKESIKV